MLVPKRDPLGNSNLTNGVNCSRNTAFIQVEWSQEPQSASGIGGVTQPIGVVYVPVGLAGCNGIIRFWTLQVSLDLTDQFDPDCWQLPEITELCQDNDEGCATNYMSVIAHVHQRPICKDNDVSAGDHDPAFTRSCRPRQKTTSDGNGPARSHPTISPTSSPRFKSGEQMHGVFQNHERDIRTSCQCHQSRRDSTAWNTVDDQTVETPRT